MNFAAMEWSRFLTGLGTAIAAGMLVRVLLGMRLNLFFINPESKIQDQMLIPITTENKKRSILRSLKLGNWRENVDITLLDLEDRPHTFQIGFHIWNRFHLTLLDGPEGTDLNRRPLRPGKRYKLRTGDKLRVGNRVFTVLVSPGQLKPELHKELWEPIT